MSTKEIQNQLKEDHKRFKRIIPSILSQYQPYQEEHLQYQQEEQNSENNFAYSQSNASGTSQNAHLAIQGTIQVEYSDLQHLYQHSNLLFKEYKNLSTFKEYQMSEYKFDLANNFSAQISDFETSKLLQTQSKIKDDLIQNNFEKISQTQNFNFYEKYSEMQNVKGLSLVNAIKDYAQDFPKLQIDGNVLNRFQQFCDSIYLQNQSAKILQPLFEKVDKIERKFFNLLNCQNHKIKRRNEKGDQTTHNINKINIYVVKLISTFKQDVLYNLSNLNKLSIKNLAIYQQQKLVKYYIFRKIAELYFYYKILKFFSFKHYILNVFRSQIIIFNQNIIEQKKMFNAKMNNQIVQEYQDAMLNIFQQLEQIIKEIDQQRGRTIFQSFPSQMEKNNYCNFQIEQGFIQSQNGCLNVFTEENQRGLIGDFNLINFANGNRSQSNEIFQDVLKTDEGAASKLHKNMISIQFLIDKVKQFISETESYIKSRDSNQSEKLEKACQTEQVDVLWDNENNQMIDDKIMLSNQLRLAFAFKELVSDCGNTIKDLNPELETILGLQTDWQQTLKYDLQQKSQQDGLSVIKNKLNFQNEQHFKAVEPLILKIDTARRQINDLKSQQQGEKKQLQAAINELGKDLQYETKKFYMDNYLSRFYFELQRDLLQRLNMCLQSRRLQIS